MSEEHGNSTLKVYGTEVTKLYGSRYLIEVRCEIVGKDDWYYENVNSGEFFKEFGDLYSSPLNIDGESSAWEPDTGEEYPDMRLVSTRLNYIPQKPNPVVTLEYETLGSTFAQESQDKVDYELNGLRRVIRPVVAKEGTTYGKTVGTSTISHSDHGYAAATLYLASAVQDKEDPDEGGRVRILEVWLEAGILSTSSKTESEGVQRVTTDFLVVEGATVGPIVARNTSNFLGLKTISVTTLQDKDGASIVAGGEKVADSYGTLVNFNYPGVVSLTTEAPALWVKKIRLSIDSAPASCKVKGTVYTIFQSASSTSVSDFSYGGSSGLWSPNSWASISARGRSEPRVGFEVDENVFFSTEALRGYRCSTASSSEIIPISPSSVSVLFYQEVQRISATTPITLNLTINQGPPDPIGSKWVMDVNIKDAFTDVDGTKYYKKTIVVTDTIPAQTSGAVPYV